MWYESKNKCKQCESMPIFIFPCLYSLLDILMNLDMIQHIEQIKSLAELVLPTLAHTCTSVRLCCVRHGSLFMSNLSFDSLKYIPYNLIKKFNEKLLSLFGVIILRVVPHSRCSWTSLQRYTNKNVIRKLTFVHDFKVLRLWMH